MNLPAPPAWVRRPLVLAALAAVALLALAGGLVCARGGDGAPPDTAARLVPASALAYVHVSTDPGRAADARFAARAAALPPLTRLRDQLVAAVAPQSLDVARDVRPWLGDELAYAAVSPADSIVLAAVADRPRAEALVARVGNLSGASAYRGVQLLVAGTTAIAFVGDFLAVGTEPAVRAAIDRDQGEGDRLADAAPFRRALEGAPAGRSLTAYASAAGVREVLAPRPGAAGLLGRLLDRPGLQAAGAALTGEDGGLRVTARVSGGAPKDARVRAGAARARPGAGGRLPRREERGAAGGARRAAGRDAGRRAAPPAAAARGPDRRRPGPARPAGRRGRALGHRARGGSRGDGRRSARRHAQGAHGGRGPHRRRARAAAAAARGPARAARNRARLPPGDDRRPRRLHAAGDARAGAQSTRSPPTASSSPPRPPGCSRRAARWPPRPPSTRPLARFRIRPTR